MKKYKKYTPFKMCVLQNFPFIEEDFDAITNYELMCKLFEELKILGVEVERIEKYLETFDVQDAVNKKLDDMAESGQLAEIISQYVNLQSVLAYNDINEMKNATNLVNGSICRTLGYNSYNDKKGSFYKIRNVVTSDIIDNINIIALNNENLVAEKINKTGMINVLEYGVMGDGETDDTIAIQKLIDTFKHHTLYFPTGTYLISSPLIVKSGNKNQINFELDDNAIIKTNETIDSLINIGGVYDEQWDRYSEGNQITINGGILDCTNVTYGIYSNGDQKMTKLSNLNLLNVDNYGIYIDRGAHSNTSNDTLITNTRIQGSGSNSSNASTGIYLYGCDNTLSDITILKTKIGIDFRGGGDKVSNIHVCTSFDTITPEQYHNTIGYNFSGNNGGIEMLENIYSDTYGTAFKINTRMHIVLNNFCTFYWYTNANLINKVFDINSDASLRLKASNGILQMPTTKLKNVIVDLDDAGSGFREFLGVYSSTLEFSNIIYGIDVIEPNDYINVCQIKNVEGLSLLNPWSTTMTVNKYYPIALVNRGFHKFNYRHDNTVYSEITVNIASTVTSSTISHKNIAGGSSVLNLALVDIGIKDKDNRPLIAVCVYSTGANVNCNPSISNIQKSWSNMLFSKEYLPQYLDIPTGTSAIATTSLSN